jgi:hypothetical protein
VRIHAVPEDATLLLDGVPLPHNPFDAERARDTALHALVVKAPGHDSRSLQLRFNRDVDMEVRLAQADQPEGTAPSSAASMSAKSALNARLPALLPRGRGPQPKRADDELYKDLPARRSGAATAPPLDTSESPW